MFSCRFLDSCDISMEMSIVYTAVSQCRDVRGSLKFLSSSLCFSSNIYDKLILRVHIQSTICSYILTLCDRHIFYQCCSTVSYPVPAVVDFFCIKSLRPADAFSGYLQPHGLAILTRVHHRRPCHLIASQNGYENDTSISGIRGRLEVSVYFSCVRWHGCIRDRHWRSYADGFPGSYTLCTSTLMLYHKEQNPTPSLILWLDAYTHNSRILNSDKVFQAASVVDSYANVGCHDDAMLRSLSTRTSGSSREVCLIQRCHRTQDSSVTIFCHPQVPFI